MKNSMISIIVPVYNVEQYLSKCLNSLVNQTYKDIEIICVNDGSLDNSIKILDDYAQKDSRIKVIDKENEGVSIARNIALKESSGEYIMFVDSDDWIDLNTCETAVNTAKEFNADVVMWSYIREYKTTSRPKNIFNQNIIIFEKNDIQNKLHRRFIGLLNEELRCPENMDALAPVWCKLYKSEIIKEHNISFKDIRSIGTYEDGLFNLFLFRYVKKAVFINMNLHHYRKVNPTSITTKYIKGLKEKSDRLYNIMQKYIDENKLSNDYQVALNNRIAFSILSVGVVEIVADCSLIKKINILKQLVKDENYKRALQQLTLKYFPIHWKVFFLFAKLRFATGIYILLYIIKKIIGKKD